MSSRRPVLWLIASLCVPVCAAGDGHYGPLPIDEDEQYLIEQSSDLESYFSAHAVLYQDERALALVRRIGHELRPQPTDDYIEYEFFILRDLSPNAFALPNVHVYVATGMLARLQDEAQLAGVLAHEINHVAGHHTIVDHRATRKKVIAGLVLGGIGGWGSVISIGLQASIYGFSRDLEQEADERAVTLIRDSRYDPHALPEVFEMLGRDYEGLDQRIPTIWSTHPEIKAPRRAARSSRICRGATGKSTSSRPPSSTSERSRSRTTTYRKVLALDPTFAAAHRGLGEVYEQQDKTREAAEGYLTHVRAAPEAPDRAIVVGRLRALTARLKGSEQ